MSQALEEPPGRISGAASHRVRRLQGDQDRRATSAAPALQAWHIAWRSAGNLGLARDLVSEFLGNLMHQLLNPFGCAFCDALGQLPAGFTCGLDQVL